MRPYPLFVAAVCTAAACSHDATSSSSPSTTGTSSSSSGLNIAVDSTEVNQTVVVGTAIPAVVHVTLTGQPAPGVAVSWIVTGGGGSVSPASSTTDASGVATATWTLGDTAHTYMLTAGITGASVTLYATATAGPLAALAKQNPDTITLAPGASTLLTVRAVDKIGNPIAGVAVSWTATGGSLTATSTTTGASGDAQVAFTSDQTIKSYSISAAATGASTVAFTILTK